MIRTPSLALLLGLACTPAFANDTTVELKTGGLNFLKSDVITMKEEQLFISHKQIKVDYIYRNDSDKPITTYVAFPMPDLIGNPNETRDISQLEGDNFLHFTVTQDGKAINPELQQRVFSGGVDMTDIVKAAHVPLNPFGQATHDALTALPKETQQDWMDRGLIIADVFEETTSGKPEFVPVWTMKSAYWWKTTFANGKDIHVSHQYNTSLGIMSAITFLTDDKPSGEQFESYKKRYCIDDAFVKTTQKLMKASTDERYYQERTISYILTTGNNWAGPIGKFTLTIDKDKPDNYISFCGENVKKTGPTTFQMTATDFAPDRDLDILMLVPNGGEW